MDRRKWLLRLIYARLVLFTIFVAAELFKTDTPVDLLVLLGAVYALSACWFGLLETQRIVRLAVLLPDCHRSPAHHMDGQPDRRRRQLFLIPLFS